MVRYYSTVIRETCGVYYLIKDSSFRAISSDAGSNSLYASGSSDERLYVATPMGIAEVLRAYSTIILLLDLQMMIPMAGFSCGSLTVSLSTLR